MEKIYGAVERFDGIQKLGDNTYEVFYGFGEDETGTYQFRQVFNFLPPFEFIKELVLDTINNDVNDKIISVFIIVIAALVFVPWMEATERLEFLVFFACLSVFLVAASPKFKEDFVSQIHYGAAGVMFISTVVWEIFNGGLYWVLGWFAVLALINRKRWVLWLEIGLFIELHITLLIREAEKVIVNLCS